MNDQEFKTTKHHLRTVFSNACYDEKQWLPHKDKSLTIIELLNDDSIPDEDKIWCLTRDQIFPKLLRMKIAFKWVNEVRHLMKDKRSTDCLDVIQRFLDGNASQEELNKAKVAVYAADDAAAAAVYAAAAAEAAVYAAAAVCAEAAAAAIYAEAAAAVCAEAAAAAAAATSRIKTRKNQVKIAVQEIEAW